MRRLAIVLALTAAAPSCKPSTPAASSTSTPPPTPTPAGSTTTSPPSTSPTIRYVLASTLKLREAPNAQARVRGRVDINSPLTVLGEQDGFTHVRVANGKDGWVGTELLGTEVLTLEQASAQAASSSTPEAKLTWLQRAAALAPADAAVLDELRAAYVAAGNANAAGIVERLLKAVRASTEAGQLRAIVDGRVEWQAFDQFAEASTFPREKWGTVGLDTAELWVLPVDAAAIRVEPRSAATEVWNECGGTAGVAVDVGRLGGDLLVLAGTPPSSWTTPPPPSWPKERFAAAQTEVEARYCKDRPGCTVAGVSSSVHGAFFQITVPGKTVDEMVSWRVIDVAIDDAGGRRELGDREHQGFSISVAPPLALRDVVGDAAPEVVFKDDCGTWVTTLAGEPVFVSMGRCCGC